MQDLLPGSQIPEFSLSNAHAQVAETCLSFLLSFEDTSTWAGLPTNIHEEAVDLSLTGFEMYACFFWASHCENARTDELKDYDQLLDKFVSVRSETVEESKVSIASTAFQKWISLLWRVFQTDNNLEDTMRRRLEDAISDPPTPLFTACIWNLTDRALEQMVQKVQTVNLRNYRGKSCLYLACENGHEKIVTALDRSRAIVDAGHERWGSDLHAAAFSGLSTIFEQMLVCGAQVNPPEGFHGRTIDAAIRGGNPAIVARALEAGAEVWVPSTDAPIRPRKRRSMALPSTEIASSGTSTDEDSGLGDSTENLITPFGVPGLGNKDSTPPQHNNLLERLRKAGRRRRELLDHWRLANNMAAVDLRVSDESVIAEEAYSYLTWRRQESAIRGPLVSFGPKTCHYCFRKMGALDPLNWR